ncbi:MAG: hypothetical protein AB1510_00305 [Bacillota bacterium]
MRDIIARGLQGVNFSRRFGRQRYFKLVKQYLEIELATRRVLERV